MRSPNRRLSSFVWSQLLVPILVLVGLGMLTLLLLVNAAYTTAVDDLSSVVPSSQSSVPRANVLDNEKLNVIDSPIDLEIDKSSSDESDNRKVLPKPPNSPPIVAESDANELNYGIIVDAGSSGSRLFLYQWPQHSGNSQELLRLTPCIDPVTKEAVVRKVSPGLSYFASHPENASSYLLPLFDYVLPFVPVNARPSVPVFILATAGMRLVQESAREAILRNLRTELRSKLPFQVLDEHIEVISGKWEGIYSWIAVNYILDSFTHIHQDATSTTEGTTESDPSKPVSVPNKSVSTVGMIDMGGASVQIAFEYSGRVPPGQQSLFETINLGCTSEDQAHSHQLYVSTFLGFGANEAMNSYERMLINQTLYNATVKHHFALDTTTKHKDNVNGDLSEKDESAKEKWLDQESNFRDFDKRSTTNSFSVGKEDVKVEEEVFKSSIKPERDGSFGGTTTRLNLEPPNIKEQIVKKKDWPSLKRRRRKRDENNNEEGKEKQAKMGATGPSVSSGVHFDVRDACLPVNMFESVFIPADIRLKYTQLDINYTKLSANSAQSSNWTLHRRGTGSFDECREKLSVLLAKNTSCEVQPCSMNGVHQPLVDLSELKLYGFSEYWYSMYDILGLGGYYDYTEYALRAREYCAQKWSILQDKFRSGLFPRADKARLRSQCLKAAWISLVLHEGFGVPKDTNRFRSAQRLKQQEVQWTLGALLHKMRYFPLRDIERKRLSEQRAQNELQSGKYSWSLYRDIRGGVFYWLLCIGVICCALFIMRLITMYCRYYGSNKYCNGSRRPYSNGKLPRNRSIWGYMMTGSKTKSSTEQDDLLGSVRVEASDYVY